MANPAIVVLAHNRPNDLRQVLQSLMALPTVNNYQVYVSMDDASSFSALEAVAHACSSTIKFWHLGHRRTTHNGALYKISSHFQFALQSGFEGGAHSHLILLEDDLQVASDFLTLFEATAWLLDVDQSNTWCVSAWNDNGLKTTTHTKVVREAERETGRAVANNLPTGLRGSITTLPSARPGPQHRLLRTGYFPGLGWMTTSRMWTQELSRLWPTQPSTGWDHYIRQQPETSGNRECIYPEIPRTKHISKHGSNVNTADQVQRFARYNFYNDAIVGGGGGGGSTAGGGWFHSMFGGSKKKDDTTRPPRNVKPLPSNSFGDTGYLLHAKYHDNMNAQLALATVLQSLHSLHSLQTSTGSTPCSYIYYYKREDFQKIAPLIGLPKTQPRGFHHGVLQTRVPGSTCLLYLIDRRTSTYVPAQFQLKMPPNIEIIGAGNGESCELACRKHGNQKCAQEAFEFLNDCAALKKIFPCEMGCGHQVGGEIPCYVNDAHQPTHQQCLVTDGNGGIACSASHKSTRRLCGCV
jgi:hypothetical protein